MCARIIIRCYQAWRVDANAVDLHDIRMLCALEPKPQPHRNLQTCALTTELREHKKSAYMVDELHEVAVDELGRDVLRYELLHNLAEQVKE